MKLQARFLQLPVKYDAERLAAEIAAIGEDAWRPHPEKFAGNDFLPLISSGGDPANEAFSGRMLPTPYLERCPYLIDVLASLGASLGRTRLMRLSGGAEVIPHVDINYYWRDRMRVHVPVITQPTVSFHCAGQQVHMAAGECWIFDTWSRHRVINDAERSRVHLVVDTVGGEGFWSLAMGARVAGDAPHPEWRASPFEPRGSKLSELDLESQNLPVVMTPWEISNHVDFLLSEAQPGAPNFGQAAQAAARFKHAWRSLWATYGEDRAGWPRYRQALNQFSVQLRASGAQQIKLSNGIDLFAPMMSLVIARALADVERESGAGEQRVDVAPSAPASFARPARGAPDPIFDRPIFIVNPPRSGSTLLFETLLQSPDLVTVGGESHGVIEGVHGLDPALRGFESNVLGAEQANDAVAAELRARFVAALRDRDGRARQGRVRMLEKTPKNALRVAFLAEVFPEARFVFLYRDPRQVLASMMEGWVSGRFRTYPNLPGWRGALPWSFLLTPGWRDLAASPLNELVASQWAITTTTLLDALETLPNEAWTVARYDALLANPSHEIARLCRQLDLGWDRELGAQLPVATHTVSKPRDDKWKSREAEIEAAWPKIAAVAERAARVAAR